MKDSTSFNIAEIIEQFSIKGEYIGSYVINDGHINDTFVVEFEDELCNISSYLLQVINTNIFKEPDKLMENIVGVTSYLRKIVKSNGGDVERETLRVFPAKDGRPYYCDSEGKCWRCYNFIKDAYTCQLIDDPKVFYNSAKAFGRFQRMLADYPIDTLHTTIPDFHDTVKRFEALEAAVQKNAAGRVHTVERELGFAFARKSDAGKLLELLNKNKLPLRVTHNDTKLNNVMFDKTTNEGICVVDLDTVMPGLSLYDFGDSIRFGANTADENERDIEKVSLSLELYEMYTKGYLEAAGNSLCKNEVDNLAFSSKLMTYECGIRFLTDYINGDTYFKINNPDDNLVRCHTQFALVADIERKLDKMNDITQRIYRGLSFE